MSPSISRRLAAATATLALLGCGDDGARWHDDGGLERLDGVVVYEDGPIRLVDVTVPTYDCAQLLVGSSVGFCPELEPGSAMGPIPMRSGDTEVVWFPAALVDAGGAARFVVFSSASPTGRPVEPIDVGEVSHLIWRLEPGEEPWGIQVLDADGALKITGAIGALPD